MPLAFPLALCSFACYLANAVLLLALHLRPSPYSPVRHAVSDFGVGPTRRLFTIYVWLGNAGALGLAGALAIGGGTPPVPPWILAVLVSMVAARFGVAVFATDLEGQRLTPSGVLHYIFAVLGFAGAYTVISSLSPLLWASETWRPAHRVVEALAMAATPALVAVTVTMWRPLRRLFGICERAFIAVVAFWFITVTGFLAYLLG